MREIGGYFELECGSTPQYHRTGVLLNSGRSALRLAIRTYGIQRLYLPFYTCPVVWEAVKAEGCECIGYQISEDFMPVEDMPKEAFILYNNYFGVCARQVNEMASRHTNLIVDNAQAFYMPLRGIASFYSPRKFFGLPDGGILLSAKEPTMPTENSTSWQRCSHLLKRWDLGASAGYEDFQKDDASLCDEGVLRMSHLTQAMMGNINYNHARQQRLENFNYLHSHLQDRNRLNIQLTGDDVPMVFPFLGEGSSLRQKLIANDIFVAKYWPNLNFVPFENIVAIPVDQRYTTTNLAKIINCVKGLNK